METGILVGTDRRIIKRIKERPERAGLSGL
jgi:hypothetical protein